MPDARRVTIDGQMMQCYTFAGFRSIVLTYVERNDLRVAVGALKDQNVLLRQSIDAWTQISLVKDQQIKLQADESKRMFELWKSENLARHKAEEKPRLGGALPWALAGVLAVSTATLLTVVVID